MRCVRQLNCRCVDVQVGGGTIGVSIDVVLMYCDAELYYEEDCGSEAFIVRFV